MRLLLKHPLFIALLGVVLIAILFFAWRWTGVDSPSISSQSQSKSFSYQKLGGENIVQAATSTYSKKSSTPALATEVLAAHSLIYRGSSLAGGSQNAPTSVAGFLASSQSVLSTDVVSYLEQASDKGAAVDTILGQMEYYRGEGEWHLQSLQSTVQEKTVEYNRCTKEKTISDATFYTALRAGDSSQVQQSIDESQVAASCQATARVLINAHKAMLERTQASYTAMGNLSMLLQNDRSRIIDHFDLFRSNQLEQLVSVRNSLRNQKFTVAQ
jgi:hypothetical protein